MAYNRGAMGTWYKVTMPKTDWNIDGKAQQLIDAFGDRLVFSGATQRDAAMFSQIDGDNVNFYFSPAAMNIARSLIQNCGGVPCSAPQRKQVNPAVGDANGIDDLWRSLGQGS